MGCKPTKGCNIHSLRQSLIDREQDGERQTLREALSEYLAGRQDDEYGEFRLGVQETSDRLRAEEDLMIGVAERRVGVSANPEWALDDVSDDDLRGAISIALRQSLIDREQDGERQTLREALSEYLAGRQDDEYGEFRLGVQETSDRLRAEEDLMIGVAERRVGVSANPEWALDDVSDDDLRNTLYRISMLMETASFSAANALKELGSLDQNVPAVHRVAALARQKRNDEAGFRRSLGSALERDPLDWRAALLLGQSYRDAGRYSDAIECTQPFIDELKGTEQPEPPRERLVFLHYTSRIWKASDQMQRRLSVDDASNALSAVIEDTRVWQRREEMDGYTETFAVLHAMALRRSVEHADTLSSDRAQALSEALDVYKQLFERATGVVGRQAFELQKLIEQFLYLYNGPDGKDYIDKVRDAVSLIAANMDALLAGAPDDRAHEWRGIMTRFRRSLGGDVVEGITDDMWDRWVVDIGEESEDGILTRIYATPPGRQFLFSEDDDGTQYYVRSWSVNVAPMQFGELIVGMHLRVWPEKGGEEGAHTAVSVSRAEVVSDAPDYLGIGESSDIGRKSGEGVVARIYWAPRGRLFLFAEDGEGTQYYVHSSRTDVTTERFVELRNGVSLRVWPSDSKDHPHHGAMPVSKAEVLG